MEKTKNIWGFTSNFLKIILLSLILVGCSVTGLHDTSNLSVDNTTYHYTITTAQDLAALSGKAIVGNILFANDIDMRGVYFVGIRVFSGIINGNGKTIKNLNIVAPGHIGPAGDAGLVREVPTNSTTEIKNLTIDSGSSIKGQFIGAFISRNDGTVTLTGLTNKAIIDGCASGGLIAHNVGTITINNSANYGAMTGDNSAGGLLASDVGTSTINNSVNYGTIVSYYAGGIVGSSVTETIINNTINYGNITSEYASGGMIGTSFTDTIINNSANYGIVDGSYLIGGMIGWVMGSGTRQIIHSYSYQAQKLVGSIFGESIELIITASYYLAGTTGVGFGGDPLTADEFKNQASFVGWDFNTIWKMGDLYPVLK